jgi:hypothetical protein
MKHLFLLIIGLIFTLTSWSQTTPTSKIILKNRDVMTGQIIEMKPGEYVKLEVVGKNVITIPYSDIAEIILDASADSKRSEAPAEKASNKKPKESLGSKKFYFETINEVGLGLGMGKIYGFNYGPLLPDAEDPANTDTYGGFYTVNGIGYKNILFAGIGIGILGHSGISDDSDAFKYSVPFTIDVRYRPLSQQQFSPIAMLGTGMSYVHGSFGTFTVLSGVGLSIRFNERFDAQILFAHHYNRFSPQLSVENGLLEEFYSGAYVNYGGARLGVSYRL